MASGGPFGAQVERAPAAAVAIGHRARAIAGARRGRGDVPCDVERGTGRLDAPVAGLGREREAVQASFALAVAGRERVRRHDVVSAVDGDAAGGDGAARRIAQIAPGRIGRVLAPVDRGQRDPCRRGRVPGQLEGELRVLEARCAFAVHAEHEARAAERIPVRRGAAHRHVVVAGRRRRQRRGVEAQRLTRVLQVVEAEPVRPGAGAAADVGALVRAAVAAIGAEQVEILLQPLHAAAGLEPRRHARAHQHGGSQRVAGQGRGVGTVEHVDVLDLGRCDDRPARREAEIGAEQVAQQQAVGIDECARRLARAGSPHGEDRVVVADEALPHGEVRRVLQRPFAGGDVDRAKGVRVDAETRAGGIRRESFLAVLRRRDDDAVEIDRRRLDAGGGQSQECGGDRWRQRHRRPCERGASRTVSCRPRPSRQ